MKTNFTKISFLFFIVFLLSFCIQAQDEEPKKVIYTVEGKNRTDKLQINKNIILPKGEITSFSISTLDTTRNYWNSKDLSDPKEIKELIKLLEKGQKVEPPEIMIGGVGMSMSYKSGYYLDINTTGDKAYFSDSDTSLVLSNFPGFIKKLEKVAGWERFDINSLEIPSSIEISYKKNKKTINDPILIKEFMSCFKEAKPTFATSCPFYNSRIYFRYKDKVISAAPAHDACNIIIINKNYFAMDGRLHKKLVKLLQRYVGFKIGP